MYIDKDRHPIAEFIIRLIYILSVIPFIINLYIFWRTDSLSDVLNDAIDGRKIDSISVNNDVLNLSDETIEDFYWSIHGYDTTIPTLPVHAPSNIAWEIEVKHHPFKSISKNACEFSIEFKNDDSLTIFYNQNGVELNNVYYTLVKNPIQEFIDDNK
ncbi:hypothetical protein [Alkalibacterium kapii]|uniref:Uncharacterized protein n=1 Tax=Alkalibacterium kapii TaxID=426704 RepID=A0A511AVM2_9LACT|nr:hypothetical protein [Alkalibacterium kapii]GEK91171.1 hypothetical protein AKA01nite_07930 [Alkalibacterium kapii]